MVSIGLNAFSLSAIGNHKATRIVTHKWFHNLETTVLAAFLRLLKSLNLNVVLFSISASN